MIKNYLEMIKLEEGKLPSEEEILKHSFYNQEQEESTCNIYFFICAYRHHNNKKGDVQISDYTKASYFAYQDLEKMFSGIVIYSQKYNQFEKDNIILRFKDSQNIKDIIEKFYKLQSVYFREYLADEDVSQEKKLKKSREYL